MREVILERLRRELLERTSLDRLPESVWKRAGALNTWGTNAIEGNTLTWHDVERLLLEERSVGGRPTKDILETLQHEMAFRGLMDRVQKPISLVTVLELHESAFRGVLSDAGTWRRVNVRIGTKYTLPRMEEVVPLMERWAKEYNQRDTAGEAVFSLAAWMHYRFESIHPLSNGNGRVGRLLLSLHFMKRNWPPVHMLPPDKDEYYSGLELGHSGDLSGLEQLLRVLMGRSLLDLLDQVGTKSDELMPLKELERRGPYSRQYLSLRAGQGELPAVMVKGDWHSSPRTLALYHQELGRASRKAKVPSPRLRG